MTYSQYQFNFYLNSSHAIFINGNQGQSHSHTWQIKINLIQGSEGFIKFSVLENRINDYLEQYQNKVMNEMPPFDIVNPTVENITEHFLKAFQELLTPMGAIIYSIEVSETPTRAYIISLVDNNISRENEIENLSKQIIQDAYTAEPEGK